MDKSLDLVITENIKREIGQSGIKKSVIAKAVGIAPATLSQYLSGRAQPTLATLSKLCSVIDCSADDILNVKKN